MHPLFKDLVYNNHWLWAHGLLALVLAKLVRLWYWSKAKRKNHLFLTDNEKKSINQKTVGIVLLVALAWEVFEWTPLYWAKPAGLLDSTGDIIIAFLTAIVFVI